VVNFLSVGICFALHCELLIIVVHCLCGHVVDLICGVFFFLSTFWVLEGV
jgi:hypothetical protein